MTGTKELREVYSSIPDTGGYSITIAWADDYGENGWADPMLDVSELSEAALAEYVETESAAGRPFPGIRIMWAIWYGDVSVVLSC